jgi:hypothetical protein
MRAGTVFPGGGRLAMSGSDPGKATEPRHYTAVEVHTTRTNGSVVSPAA